MFHSSPINNTGLTRKMCQILRFASAQPYGNTFMYALHGSFDKSQIPRKPKRRRGDLRMTYSQITHFLRKSCIKIRFPLLIALLLLSGCESNKEFITKQPNVSPKLIRLPPKRPKPTAPGNINIGKTIRLGVVPSLTGNFSSRGKEEITAIKMAINQCNAQGGIKGKKIQLFIEDNASSPDKAAEKAKKLIIKDKVIGILGGVVSGITISVADECYKYGIPLLITSSTNVTITEIGDNIFRVCYTDDLQGTAMAIFSYNTLQLQDVGIMTDRKQLYSTGLSYSFRLAFEQLGGRIVEEQFYETGELEFNRQLLAIQMKRPRGVFISGYSAEAIEIIRQSKKVGLDAIKFGGDAWEAPDLLQSGPAVFGGYYCNHYSYQENRPEVKQFIAKWKAKTGEIPRSHIQALGYDVSTVIIDALRRCKKLDSKSLTEALASTVNIQGVTGNIILKGMQGNPHKNFVILKIGHQGPRLFKVIKYKEVVQYKAIN